MGVVVDCLLTAAWLQFAEVVEGTETLRKLEAAGSPGAGRPTKPLTIDKATITVE